MANEDNRAGLLLRLNCNHIVSRDNLDVLDFLNLLDGWLGLSLGFRFPCWHHLLFGLVLLSFVEYWLASKVGVLFL